MPDLSATAFDQMRVIIDSFLTPEGLADDTCCNAKHEKESGSGKSMLGREVSVDEVTALPFVVNGVLVLDLLISEACSI